MRVTIDQGAAFVGVSLFLPLHTRDFATACDMRDQIFHVLQRTGKLTRPIVTLDTNSIASAVPESAA